MTKAHLSWGPNYCSVCKRIFLLALFLSLFISFNSYKCMFVNMPAICGDRLMKIKPTENQFLSSIEKQSLAFVQGDWTIIFRRPYSHDFDILWELQTTLSSAKLKQKCIIISTTPLIHVLKYLHSCTYLSYAGWQFKSEIISVSFKNKVFTTTWRSRNYETIIDNDLRES